MAIATEKGVFILTPRCGSNYVRKFIQKNEIPHFTLYCPNYSTHTPFNVIKKIFPNQKYYALCRNNVGWYKSVWGLQKSNDWMVWEPKKWHPFRPIENIIENDYDKWLERVKKEVPDFWESTMKAYGCEEKEVQTINLINLTQTIADIFSVPQIHDIINPTNYDLI